MNTTRLTQSNLDLFGGTKPWVSSTSTWIAVDDRVRGGSSQSSLTQPSGSTNALFAGTLDIKTLGGAGFASQRTDISDEVRDLSDYDGLEIRIDKGDGKVYTLIVRDETPAEKRDDGREKAGINWEHDFKVCDGAAGSDGMAIPVAWTDFKPTYRGKDKADAEPLKKDQIRSISLMMRSFFGTQEGDFETELQSISAIGRRSSNQGLAATSFINGTSETVA